MGFHKAIGRQARYMATVAARRGNDSIRSYYHRLRQQGQAKKLAITACMRKLLTVLNTLVKNQQPWKPPGGYSLSANTVASMTIHMGRGNGFRGRGEYFGREKISRQEL